MGNPAESYFKNLMSLMGSVNVTGGDGAAMDLDMGVEMSCRIIAGRPLKVMLIGNGGSAAIASHMAVDFWKNGGIRATAFNDSSSLTCLGNDFGYEHVFEKPIGMFAEQGDVLIAISSSGRSENILRGVGEARARGCRVITLSGFGPDNPLRLLGDINFHVPSEAYGPVETVHQAICHCILDTIMVEQGKLQPGSYRHAG